MTNETILIVEDDVWFAKFIDRTLSHEGFQVNVIPSGDNLFQEIEDRDYGAVVLDLGLPDEDGIVLARKLRARSAVPIIVVTGRVDLDDKLASFDVGADDYLTKPVEPKELAARLRAVMRRSAGTDSAGDKLFTFGVYTLDMERREVIDGNGNAIDLTPAEFSVLAILCQSDGQALSRDTLVDAVSSGEGPLSTRAIDILVSRIRKKLDKSVVETVTRAGYRITKGHPNA